MTSGQAPAQAPDHSGPALFLLGLVMAGFLLVVWGVDREVEEPPVHEPPPFEQERDSDRDRARDRGDGQQAARQGRQGVG